MCLPIGHFLNIFYFYVKKLKIGTRDNYSVVISNTMSNIVFMVFIEELAVLKYHHTISINFYTGIRGVQKRYPMRKQK